MLDSTSTVYLPFTVPCGGNAARERLTKLDRITMDRKELHTHCGTVTIGTRIHINHLNNPNSSVDDSDYDGREGTVEYFDALPDEFLPGMHGTWGGLAVYDTDDFKILL